MTGCSAPRLIAPGVCWMADRVPCSGEDPAAPPELRPRRRNGMRMIGFDLLLPGALLLAGGVLGWFSRSLLGRNKIDTVRGESREIIERTRQETDHQKRQAILQAREEWLKSKSRLEQELQNKVREGEKRQRALDARDADLSEKDARLRARERTLEQREREAQQAGAEARLERDKARSAAADLNGQLGRVSGLTLEDAKQMLLTNMRQEVRFEAARMIREAREETHKKAEMEACKIVSLAIQRTASEWTAETWHLRRACPCGTTG